MATEMESFLCKFKNLQYAGFKATLTFEAENGEAFVTLKAGLGCLPPPQYAHPGYHGHGHVPQVYRAPAYYRRQERRKAARAVAGQEARQAEQVCDEAVEEIPTEVNEVAEEAIAEEAIDIHSDKNDKATEEATEKFECLICDFQSNWENGFKVHMSRKHSRIDQLDGSTDPVDDENYAGSKHYWTTGWLGSAYQSFIDANEVLKNCDIPEKDKNSEKAKLLDARKTALGARFMDFSPWNK